jgi:outer membrane protein TolC
MIRFRIGYAAFALAASLLGVAPAGAQPAPPETLSLTLADAVHRALEHNPDLAIVQMDTAVESARVGETRGAYAPVFSTTAGRTRDVTPPTSALVGDTGIDTHDWFSSTGVRQRVPWGGGAWSVSWDAARTTSTNPFTSFDPDLESGIQAAFSQPLLKDRAIDNERHQYIVARRNQQSSELQFREAVVQTVAAVKQAYWTLKAAAANVGVQERSLELAAELARQNRIRVDAGQIPPLDLVQAEAEVAGRREALIEARATAGDAEDHLRRLIIDPADSGFWRVTIDPVDTPAEPGGLPDADAAVALALGTRTDLARAANDLENARTDVAYLGNQRLPDLRVEASYRGNGLGGTQLVRTGTFPGLVTATRDSSFGTAIGQAFSSDYPTWSLGVTLSYPLGRSTEEASFARATIERDQAERRLASLRLDAAETIHRAARHVQSTGQRIEAARAAAALAERRVDDEQRRFDVGLSTTFLVTQAQRDLLQAQVTVLQTMLDYQSAAVAFDALQEAPAPGAGGVVTLRGADVVLQPPPSPRGIFRAGGGQ